MNGAFINFTFAVACFGAACGSIINGAPTAASVWLATTVILGTRLWTGKGGEL